MLSEFFSSLKSKITFVSEHNHHRNRNIYDVFTNVIRLRKGFAIAFSLLFSLTVTVAYASPASYEVAIIDEDNYYSLMTPRATVAEVLASNGIELDKYDIVSPELDNMISASQSIVIQRVNKVSLSLEGEIKEYYTTADTVADFLDEKGITLDEYDIINLDLEEELDSENAIEIIRVVKYIVETDKEVPYEKRTVEDASMLEGTTKVVTDGINGVERESYEVVLHDGEEVSREFVSSYIAQEPVHEVTAIGTKKEEVKVETPAPSGKNFSYSKVLTCTATAYDLSFQSCGKRPGHPAYGITASGTRAKVGTVAVDPRVIPLGTKMYIESVDGQYVYGYCTAEDTGGAIKGYKVDLFYNTTAECYQFGRRAVRVYILS